MCGVWLLSFLDESKEAGGSGWFSFEDDLSADVRLDIYILKVTPLSQYWQYVKARVARVLWMWYIHGGIHTAVQQWYIHGGTHTAAVGRAY